MGNGIDLDLNSLNLAIEYLRRQADVLGSRTAETGRSGLTAFSTVSGFRGVGLRLGRVSSFYSPEALGSLADHCCVGGSHG